MIKTIIYQKQNVLHLCLEGNICLNDFHLLENRLPSTLRCLRPDFILLSDLSSVGVIDYACGKSIANLMERIVEAGVGKVFRVVPDPRKDIGLGILAIFHYPKALSVRVYPDLLKAMKALGMDCESVLNSDFAPAPNADLPMRKEQVIESHLQI